MNTHNAQTTKPSFPTTFCYSELEEMINEVAGLATGHTLVEYTHSQYGWDWNYSTRKEGKSGHFITVAYLPTPVSSGHHTVQAQGDSFFDAVRRAGREVLTRLN